MSVNAKDIPEVYTRSDFDQIAGAIGKPTQQILVHTRDFEIAAMWYRLDNTGKRQVAPSRIKRKLASVRTAAQRLLKNLDIARIGDAVDGPGNELIFEVLSSVGGMNEDRVAYATDRVGRLAAVLDAIDAADELDHLAEQASKDVEQIGKLTVPKGHHGHSAENDWTAAMLGIYQAITGSKPATSVAAPGRHNEGTATGPLIRFLAAAGPPVGIAYDEDAWRSRVRVILRNTP